MPQAHITVQANVIARKSQIVITAKCHSGHKKSKASSSLFLSEMIAELENKVLQNNTEIS